MSELIEYVTIDNIVTIIVGMIGIILIIHGAWKNWKINKACRWPSTQATVEWTSLTTTNFLSARKPVDSIVTISADDPNIYAPKIIYKYTVNKIQYYSDNIVYNGAKTFRIGNTKKIMTDLNPRTKIIIHYNPLNPSESYIHNGNTTYFQIIGGLILILIVSYLGYFYSMKENKK